MGSHMFLTRAMLPRTMQILLLKPHVTLCKLSAPDENDCQLGGLRPALSSSTCTKSKGYVAGYSRRGSEWQKRCAPTVDDTRQVLRSFTIGRKPDTAGLEDD